MAIVLPTGLNAERVRIAFAKLAGLHASVSALLSSVGPGNKPPANFSIGAAQNYFLKAEHLFGVLRSDGSALFGDFDIFDVEPHVRMADGTYAYSREHVEALARAVGEVFEIRSHSELGVPQFCTDRPKRKVFISHGRAPDWKDVQAHVEKVIGIDTIELEQQASMGRSILQKLDDESSKCDYAVIIMTGDDQSAAGEAQARPNVIHEIGFFQARFGMDRVCLLHEDGVQIPSNIAGLVYVPFTRGAVIASFGPLLKELKAAYDLKL